MQPDNCGEEQILHSTSHRMVAEIPAAKRRQGIRWLVLEYDTEDSGGYFLLFHAFLKGPSIFDNWYERRELALQHAMEEYGVRESDWRREEDPHPSS